MASFTGLLAFLAILEQGMVFGVAKISAKIKLPISKCHRFFYIISTSFISFDIFIRLTVTMKNHDFPGT